MIRQRYSKKGVVLIELIIVLVIIVILELLLLTKYREIRLKSYNLKNEYLLEQTSALKDSCKKIVDTEKYGIYDNLSINHSGNVNHATTYTVDYHKLVITLGTGKIHEKR